MLKDISIDPEKAALERRGHNSPKPKMGKKYNRDSKWRYNTDEWYLARILDSDFDYCLPREIADMQTRTRPGLPIGCASDPLEYREKYHEDNCFVVYRYPDRDHSEYSYEAVDKMTGKVIGRAISRGWEALKFAHENRPTLTIY